MKKTTQQKESSCLFPREIPTPPFQHSFIPNWVLQTHTVLDVSECVDRLKVKITSKIISTEMSSFRTGIFLHICGSIILHSYILRELG